jgi:hypothetical protein
MLPLDEKSTWLTGRAAPVPPRGVPPYFFADTTNGFAKTLSIVNPVPRFRAILPRIAQHRMEQSYGRR